MERCFLFSGRPGALTARLRSPHFAGACSRIISFVSTNRATMTDTNEELREEVRKEFQLDRMILFSDAVFAIVITLMAIEIRLPETEGTAHLTEALVHLLPVFVAYITSFSFIGAIWYQHLRMFGVLKDYDRGLVVRNLVLLFMVGLFPFGVTVITRAKGSSLGFALYTAIIVACLLAQYALQHYILVERTSLCIRGDLSEQRYALKRRKVALIAAAIGFSLILVTQRLVTEPILHSLAFFWVLIIPIAMRRFAKKKAVEREKAIVK